MRISMICCPFQTSSGFYGSALGAAIERRTGVPVQWVATNCGCGDPQEANRVFQASNPDYFEMPVPADFQSRYAWRRKVRGLARSIVFSAKARRFCGLSRGADVVHFQQILNAYGSKTVFAWLRQPSTAVRVVTVHELDSDQQRAKAANLAYNRADAVLVHCQQLKDELVDLKVQPERIHVVLHGTRLPARSTATRSGMVFYGGHKLMSNKGLDTLLEAMAMLKQRMGPRTPVLSIHGYYGLHTPAEATELAQKNGVADKVVWVNQVCEEEVTRLYQRSLLAVLPYVGSFAGGAAAHAAACELPVIGTRHAGLPDHLADAGIWVEENHPVELAERIEFLVSHERARREAAERCYARAHEYLGWDRIAEQTLQIYENCCSKRSAA
jgi:glycosyltransferase involved in cell wall biosynthesis